MRHRVVAPALSVLAAGLFATVSPSLASAADPSGIWVRDDGSAKVEIGPGPTFRPSRRGFVTLLVFSRGERSEQQASCGGGCRSPRAE